MIILLAGYPKSGKSEIAKILYKDLKSDPGSFWFHLGNMVPKDMSNIPDDVRTAINIAAWEEIMDKFQRNVMRNTYEVMIIDLCNPYNYSTSNFLSIARSRGQSIITIFCNRPLQDCIECADGQPDASAFDKYTEKFKYSLPKLKESSDKFIKINNDGDLATLHNKAEKVRSKLCLSTSTTETMT